MFERPRAKIIFGRKCPSSFPSHEKYLMTTSFEKYFVDDLVWERSSQRRKIKMRKRAENENKRAQRNPWRDTGPPTRSRTRSCYAELNRDYSYRWKNIWKTASPMWKKMLSFPKVPLNALCMKKNRWKRKLKRKSETEKHRKIGSISMTSHISTQDK